MSDFRISREELETFVPHSGTMLLLDGIFDWQDDFTGLTAIATVDEDNPFAEEQSGEVSVIVGFEYMAQAVASLSGLERHLRGESEPRPGYIIGVRGYRSHAPSLPRETELEISVTQLFRDGPVVSFECRILDSGRVLAEGTINAYEPARGE